MTPVDQLSDFDQSLVDSPKKLRREMAMTKYRGDLVQKGFTAIKSNYLGCGDQVRLLREAQLKAVAFRSIKLNLETNKSLRAIENWMKSKHEMLIQRRAITGLKWYVDYRA